MLRWRNPRWLLRAVDRRGLPLVASGMAWGISGRAAAMHLADGILPLGWAVAWTAPALLAVIWALRQLRSEGARDHRYKPFVAMVAAAVFVISCMPIPVPIAGTCSHPCGTGLSALIVGPRMTVLISVVALLLQAVFLAHGGITTLGANVVSMGIVGPFVGYGTFRVARAVGLPLWFSAFLTGLLSDWATYATTAFELATALHGVAPLWRTFGAIALAFAPTQVPLGLLEGVLSAGAIVFLRQRRPALLSLSAALGSPLASHARAPAGAV